ncbi:hypothetical protein ACLMJK_006643 [Lecanora helva]
MGDTQQRRGFSSMIGTSQETFPPISASPSSYFGAPNVLFDVTKGSAGQSLSHNPSSASPSPSASHTFDHPPSRLSSASGASAQSTASSADNSPYANAAQSLPYQEKWSDPVHGLGITPGIVNGEGFHHEAFPQPNLENDLILEGDKFHSYVGECSQSFPESTSSNSSAVPSVSPTSKFQNVLPAFSSPAPASDTTAGPHDVTIDTILEEVNSSVRNPTNLISPTTTGTHAAKQCRRGSPTERRASFKSPRTPASASSRFSSPTSSRGSGNGSPKRQMGDVSDPWRQQKEPQRIEQRFHPYH